MVTWYPTKTNVMLVVFQLSIFLMHLLVLLGLINMVTHFLILLFFSFFFFFFCRVFLGFLSRTFTIHRTAGEGGGYFSKSSLPLPPALKHLGISRAVTAKRSPLHTASIQTWTGSLWFQSDVCCLLFLFL